MQPPHGPSLTCIMFGHRPSAAIPVSANFIDRGAPDWRNDRIAPSSNSTGPGFLSNSHDFQVDNFEYNVYNQAAKSKGWDTLVTATAPNALFDAKARFDPPKCDEDTRVELIREIMDWIRNREAPQRLLYMTGAAGAGKSALQQTISENCAGSEILAASFFFSAGDGTRNNTARLIPTIAYQLGLTSTALRKMIERTVENDPLIFDRSLMSQMEALILNPVSRLSPSELLALPYAILVDGLDECSNEDSQKEFLRVIDYCVVKDRTPFCFFVASRPEMVVQEALRPGGYLHKAAYPIQLSDSGRYDASTDIRRTVSRRLRELGEMMNLEETWFSETDVDKIVEAASGQYIYAATVMRYVSQRRGAPKTRLRTVLDWAPGKKQSKAKPFAALDRLYMLILSRAKEEYEAVDTNEHDFLLVLNCYCLRADYNYFLSFYDQILGLEEGAYKSIVGDLQSLVKDKGGRLVLYHKSFQDFLFDEGRVGAFYAQSRALAHTVSCCLQRISESDHLSEVAIRLLAATTNQYFNQHSTLPEPHRVVDSFIEFFKASGGGWVLIEKLLLHRLFLHNFNLPVKPYQVEDTSNAFTRLFPFMRDKAPEACAFARDCRDRWSAWQKWNRDEAINFIQDLTPITQQKLQQYYNSSSHSEADRMFLHKVLASLVYQPPSSSS
ncbi:hypothetical protein D9611_011187 [Ephemerocybe angulata]|uniref:Nephrocystin 3-like N-terminal domain-containing protein n=1 Tax=Ephemerocybe angulata TaxID=980116 RepID=A0A8H5CCG9_9AGAR|nr:hypothetical protein D9611_011187 [Tulosesus angulatus]